ncbi:MAG: transcription termination factor Rho [Patescibacteria group bacterium]
MPVKKIANDSSQDETVAIADLVGSREPKVAEEPTRPSIEPLAPKAFKPSNSMKPMPLRKNFTGLVDERRIPDADAPTETIIGVLDTSPDGHGLLRPAFSPSDRDAYISSSQIRKFRLRPGDMVEGPARSPKENERYWGLLKVEKVNGMTPDQIVHRVKFSNLIPVYPNEKFNLETGQEPLSNRIIELVAPIGKGQRGMIVSPPKAGKTTIMKDLATALARNHPESHLMAVLIGERPEEVTDISRHIIEITKGQGETAASNFDERAEDQCRVAEVALERAKRLVEQGQDVVILLDSITRLARAYNLAIPTSGRTLSGGFDPAALHPPKKFFGAARNFEVGGSLTIIATCLVDTGSRMDDLVYEEFKGTGNQELHLDRRLAERRIYPAINIQKSGTRRDDLLYDSQTYQSIVTLHRMFDMLNEDERTPTFIERLKKTKSNKDFLASLKEG